MSDYLGTEREYLMQVFDLTIAIDDAGKEKIRHRVQARIREVEDITFGDARIQILFVLGGLACGLFFSIGLAFFRSTGLVALNRIGAAAIALLAIACVRVLITDKVLGRFIASVPALYLISSAIVVMALRTLSLISTKIPVWTNIGLRSGLTAAIISLCIIMLGVIYEPISMRMSPHGRSSKQPEAFIIKQLLQIVSYLEELDYLRESKDQLILEKLAKQKRREDDCEQARRECPEGQSICELIERTELNDGTFTETYTLQIVHSDGSTEASRIEQETRATRNPFMDEPEWANICKKLAFCIEDVAVNMERSLPEKMGVGDEQLDQWTKRELQARAQTVRNWTQRIVLPTQTDYQSLLAEVGFVISHAAIDHWSALEKSEVANHMRFGHRILRFCRKVIVGAIPLMIIAAAPRFGIIIPLPIRDSLLTFAVPWTLLQIVELIVPDASESLSRSKGIRELLPATFGGNVK